MAVLNLFQLRLNLHAVLGAVLAAASKRASRRQVQRTRDFAFQRLNLFARFEVYLKYSTHKCLGVRMLAVFCNTAVLHPFYYITQVHYRNLMAHQVYQTKVMSNEQVSNIFFFLNTAQQLADFFLYGNVQRTGRFVAHDNLRLQCQSAGNAQTLTLTAGHAVRIAVLEFSRQLNHFQQLCCFSIYLAVFNQAEVFQRLGEDILNKHLWVEGSSRILEHHLDVLSVLTQLFTIGLHQIMAFENCFTAGSRVNTQQSTHQCTLAAAGFTDDAQGTAFVCTQVDVIAGSQKLAAVNCEFFSKVVNLQYQFSTFIGRFFIIAHNMSYLL